MLSILWYAGSLKDNEENSTDACGSKCERERMSVCVLYWDWVERVFVNERRLVWGSVVKAIEFVRDREGERERERKRESESGLEKPIVTIVQICKWCWRRKKKDLSDHQNGDSVTTTKPKLFLFRRQQKRWESKTPRLFNESSWHPTTSFRFEVEWGENMAGPLVRIPTTAFILQHN